MLDSQIASNFFTSYTEAASQLSQLHVLKIEISIWLKVRRGKTSGGNVRVRDSTLKGQVGNPWKDFGYAIW